MPAPELYRYFLQPLEAAGISYMVTGGVAAIVYGEPRLTNDVDVILSLRPEDAGRLANAFASPAYYVPPIEVIAEEAARSRWGHFNLLHIESALRADVYLLGDAPLGVWGMQHRRSIALGDNFIWLAPMEYVILNKLAYYREGRSGRHLRDIKAMLRLSGDLLDESALKGWLSQLGLEDEWALVASSQD
jgi:hypothetical protein